MPSPYFSDTRFQDALASLLIKDRDALRLCHSLVTAKDFRPKKASSETDKARWVTVTVALSHFEKYREPIGQIITAAVKAHCHKNHINGDQLRELVAYSNKALKRKIPAPAAITDKVLEFKRELLKANAVDQLIELQSRGELTDEKWLEISREAVELLGPHKYEAIDYFKESEARIDRRKFQRTDRFPLLFIQEFDFHMRAIARGHVGLLLAPYKRGKSLGLIHIAKAYTIQRMNTLYITLEDPVLDVEDRFDASITYLPIKTIGQMPRTFRRRFKNFRRHVRSRLKIVDGTEKNVTVPLIEDWIDEERSKGFLIDAVIIDYDDELKAVKSNQDRRMEFAEIYRDLRKLASRKNVALWTAAQTQRNTMGLKILSGDRLAEDVSKVRKVSMALALGQGDWGEDSIYLHVAAHKFDKQHFGVNIMTNKAKMLFYDAELTAKARKHPEKYRPREDDDE